MMDGPGSQHSGGREGQQRAACVSFSVVTEEMLNSPVDPAKRRLRLAAEIDGELVAAGTAQLDPYIGHGAGNMSIMVHPRFRSQGVATELYRRFDAHLTELGALRVTANSLDDIGTGFAERRGFVKGRTTQVSEIDPRLVRPLPAPAGVTLRPASDLPDLRAAYEVARTFAPDIPSSAPYVELPYDEWVAARKQALGLDLDCCFVAFDGDQPIALTLTGIERTNMVTTLTGTHPEHRRRGYARLVKSAALHAAAAKGVTNALTFNDTENTAVLAFNERFGYRAHTVGCELIQTRG